MRPAAIIVLCVAAACLYGIAHDQITARICVEYFTVYHPPVFATDDPTLLGLGWGIIATWWVGLLLGVCLALAATAGRRQPRTVRSLIRPVFGLMAIMAGCAATAGLIGYLFGSAGALQLDESLRADIPADRHARFWACLFAHTTSYFVGFVGGLVQVGRVWLSRRSGVPT